MQWRRLRPGWTLRSGVKAEIKSYAEWVVYNDIFVDGEYDIAIEDVLNSSSTDEEITIVDLGANVGFFLMRILDLMNRPPSRNRKLKAYLVEASPDLCSELKRRIQIQEISVGHTEILNALVGRKSGVATYRESSFHIANAVANHQLKTGNCAYFDLDPLFAGLDRVDLVKCDIEGSEEPFLECYSNILPKIQRVIVEFHKELCDVTRSRNLLEAAGFNLHSKIKDNPSNTLEYFVKR